MKKKSITKLIILVLVGLLMIGVSCKKDEDVKTPDPATIAINEGDQDIYVNETVQLSATITNTESTITWSSASSIVASVNSTGLVTAHNTGTVKIKAALTDDQTVSSEITITVTKRPKAVTSITINSESVLKQYVDEFDLSKILIDVVYDDSTTNTLALTSSMIDLSIDEVSLEGIHNVVVSYGEQSLSVNIEVLYRGTPGLILTLSTYGDYYSVAGYSGSDTFVEIPSVYRNVPVTHISDKAFFGNAVIKKAVLPNSITSIGEAAFYNCPNLSTIVIPRTVETVKSHALYSVKILYLESSTINSKWASDCHNAQQTYIHYDTKIETLTIENDFEYYIRDGYAVISDYLGNSAEIITPVAFGDYPVKVIGGALFKNNEATSITIPSGVITIEDYAFANAENMTTLNLPNTLITLGDCSIRECLSLTTLKLPDTLETIGANAFNQTNALTRLVIPSNVKSIGEYAFSWCTSIRELYIPKSVTTIGEGACYSCSIATIYLEVAEALPGWNATWNMSKRPLTFNATMPEE